MNRRLLLLSLLAAVPGAARAAEGKAKTEEGGQSVTLSPVALPIVVDGKLVNYVFVSLRLDLAASANAARLREKEPYFRDALIRAAHRAPFTAPGDPTKLDEPRLKATMLREARSITGNGDVRAVTILNQAPKSLHVRVP